MNIVILLILSCSVCEVEVGSSPGYPLANRRRQSSHKRTRYAAAAIQAFQLPRLQTTYKPDTSMVVPLKYLQPNPPTQYIHVEHPSSLPNISLHSTSQQ